MAAEDVRTSVVGSSSRWRIAAGDARFQLEWQDHDLGPTCHHDSPCSPTRRLVATLLLSDKVALPTGRALWRSKTRYNDMPLSDPEAGVKTSNNVHGIDRRGEPPFFPARRTYDCPR